MFEKEITFDDMDNTVKLSKNAGKPRGGKN
jgi:hypothetical protein